jgi:hypothetical protein
MNCNQATSPVLVPPLTERVAADVLDALHSAAVAVARLWQRPNASQLGERAFDSIAHLNEYALKDIGAPDWLVARAAERREAQHLRWIELEAR